MSLRLTIIIFGPGRAAQNTSHQSRKHSLLPIYSTYLYTVILLSFDIRLIMLWLVIMNVIIREE